MAVESTPGRARGRRRRADAARRRSATAAARSAWRCCSSAPSSSCSPSTTWSSARCRPTPTRGSPARCRTRATSRSTTTRRSTTQLSLARALFNSGVFTGAVILGTVVFGLLAGYALAVLSFRGKGTVFASLLLVQVVPFQLLTIPLYVLIVRDYGLADSYLGMILPFAINSTAVFVFRQFFLQLPRELFDAARIDGASELTILLRIAVPLSKPALLTAVLLTFIGPWNEFLWPFLVTKEQDMQPLAVSLANYISTVSGPRLQPVRGDPRRRVRAGRAGGRAVHRLPEAVRPEQPRLGGEGMTRAVHADPARRRDGAGPRRTARGRGRPQPRQRAHARRAPAPAAAPGRGGQRLARRARRGDPDATACPSGVRAPRRRARARRGLGAREGDRGRRGPARHHDRRASAGT